MLRIPQSTAPSLVVAVKAGKHGPALRRINPAAITYAAARGAPLTVAYPDAGRTLRELAPPLLREGRHGGARRHKWRVLNRNAIEFARAAGLPFAQVYPDPPPWSSHVHGSKEAAQMYARLVGRPFDGPKGVYFNWYHPAQFGADWSSNEAMVCAQVAGEDTIGSESETSRVGWSVSVVGLGLVVLLTGFAGAALGGAIGGLFVRLGRREALPAAHGVAASQVAALAPVREEAA